MKTLLRLLRVIYCKVVIPEIVQNRGRARSDLEGADVKLFCLGIAPLCVEDYGNQAQGLEILRMRLQDGPESTLSIGSAPILKILYSLFVNGIGRRGLATSDIVKAGKQGDTKRRPSCDNSPGKHFRTN